MINVEQNLVTDMACEPGYNMCDGPKEHQLEPRKSENPQSSASNKCGYCTYHTSWCYQSALQLQHFRAIFGLDSIGGDCY